MIIEGLECPGCGSGVLDNGDTCPHCGIPHTKEIQSLQRLHHSQKMANVGAMKEGTMTRAEALRKLPRVVGRSGDGHLIVDVPCKEPTVEPEIAPLENLIGRARKFFGSLRV